MREGRSLGFYLLAAFFAAYVLFLYGPMIVIFVLSFQGPAGGMTFPMRGLSFHWFQKLWEGGGIVDIGSAFERSLGNESRRLHYLSVPPNAALSAVRLLGDAGLVERSRVIMEKPFGTDLASAVTLNAKLHEVFREDQIFRIDHFLGKEPAQNILAFRFANGLFEPIWNRNFIDHVQIDVPETLGLGQRSAFYEATGA